MRLGDCRSCGCFAAIFFAASLTWAGDASRFNFHRDTLAFANSTVFAYQQGKIVSYGDPDQKQKPKRYTRRCFVMSRTVIQFYKFAKFDPHASPLDDKELAKRIRAVTRKPPGHRTCPPGQRMFFPAPRNCPELDPPPTGLLQRTAG